VATISSQLFGKADSPEEQQRLERLFLNRAELKREYEQQRRIAESNAERLRQQEIATLRAEQNLEKLEALLADPATAYQAMAFYQLRSLWVHGRKRVQRMASELYEEILEAERRQWLDDYEASKHVTIQGVRDQLNEISARGDELSSRVSELQAARDELRGFWNFFRRRALSERIEDFAAAHGAVKKQIQQLVDKTYEESESRPPEFPGLSVKGRRAINIRLIALAQELYLWFREDKLADMAREASVCQVTDVRYGAGSDCRALGSLIRSRIHDLAVDNDLQKRIDERAAYLQKTVEYRNDRDAVPEAGSLYEVTVNVKKPADIAPASVNVLALEYWDIFDALIP